MQGQGKDKDLNSKSASDLSEDLFKVHDFDVKIDLQVPSSGRWGVAKGPSQPARRPVSGKKWVFLLLRAYRGCRSVREGIGTVRKATERVKHKTERTA